MSEILLVVLHRVPQRAVLTPTSTTILFRLGANIPFHNFVPYLELTEVILEYKISDAD